MLTSRNFRLSREKTVAMLHELETCNEEEAISIFVPPGTLIADIESILKKTPGSELLPQGVSKLAGSYETGSMLFWGSTNKYLISPPFPLKEKYISGGYEVEPLLTLLMKDFSIGIVLVRLGSYSIGICYGENLLDHHTGTGLVHGRHRQGGSSSARFQRRRQDQIYHFLERAGEHIEEKFKMYAKNLDYLVYGGAWTTIQQLRKQCSFLQQFDDRLLPPLLKIPDPKFNILEKAVQDIWSCKITEWREE